MIQIAILDDHLVFADGIATIIGQQEDMFLGVKADNLKKLAIDINALDAMPDILLLDINLGKENGIELLPSIQSLLPDTPIIILTMHNEPAYIMRAMEKGVRGYLLKSVGSEELLHAIRTVNQGKDYFNADISKLMMNELRKKQDSKPDEKKQRLSNREIEIIQLVCNEYTNKEIAAHLYISVRTVDTHKRNILQKLGVKSVAGLVKYAIQHGLTSDS